MAIRPAILIAFLLALPASAQDDEVVHTKLVSATADRETVKPGETVQLKFTLRIDPDWHIYSALGKTSPTEWRFEGPVEAAGPVVEPKPKQHSETLADGTLFEYAYHEGEVQFTVPVRLTADAVNGPFKISGTIKGLECDPRICLGLEIPFEVPVKVEGGKEPGPDYHTKIESVTWDGDSTLVFKVSIDPGWHIYSAVKDYNRTHWKFDGGLEVAGPVVEPEPKYKKMEFGEDSFLEYWYHEGDVTFRVPVRGGKPGKVTGRMIGQECDPSFCVNLEIPFTVTQEKTAQGSPAPVPPKAVNGDEEAAQQELERRGIIGFLGLAVLGGLISLIMPCTYPMIPVTLTYFLKQGGESRGKGLLMSLVYALGIVVSFTAIGFILSIAFGADGPRRLAANPWANVIIGAIFFYFAFSLFGLYEIKLPSFVTQSAASSPRSGVGGAFMLGLLFSIVTFTCTIPIAATVLAVAASTGGGHKLFGLLAMLAYSLTMAVPFIILGLFPSLLREVPKSGGWLQTVKVTTAFAELGLALAYFAKADLVWDVGILSRQVMIAVWVAVLAFMSLYLLGLFRMKGDTPPPHLGVARILCAMVFGVSAVYLGFATKSAGVFDTVLPAYIESSSKDSPEAAKGVVFENFEQALEEAKRTRKPLFVEFTGVT